MLDDVSGSLGQSARKSDAILRNIYHFRLPCDYIGNAVSVEG